MDVFVFLIILFVFMILFVYFMGGEFLAVATIWLSSNFDTISIVFWIVLAIAVIIYSICIKKLCTLTTVTLGIPLQYCFFAYLDKLKDFVYLPKFSSYFFMIFISLFFIASILVIIAEIVSLVIAEYDFVDGDDRIFWNWPVLITNIAYPVLNTLIIYGFAQFFLS